MKIQWNHILLEEKILKIKSDGLRNYFLKFFNLKNFTIRICSLFLIILVSSLLFFILRAEALASNSINVLFNSGFAWGIGDDWDQSIVYLLKIVPTIIFFLAAFYFLEWYAYIPLYLVAVNSLLNVIDKALVDTYMGIDHYNAVVDYFYWFNFKFTNNIADILIIVGATGSVIAIIYILVKEFMKDRKEKPQHEDQSTDNQTDQ